MEAAVSAVTDDLVSRFISFLAQKYTNQSGFDEKLERLQHLLLRIHTVVEEAEGRYITNSGMLIQLRMFVEAMYRGHHVLDNLKYEALEEIAKEEVNNSSAFSFAAPLKYFRRTTGKTKGIAKFRQLQSVLENLEIIVASMTEFVILLGGCDRMFRGPYDTYLHIDNFMFARCMEKQQIINILLQKSSQLDELVVLPIIGGHAVGKKTLVAHACNNERVRSHFSSILHVCGDDIWRLGHEMITYEKTLVVAEFVSDVNEENWVKFLSFVKRMGRGSKVIIISRLEKLERYGTTKAIRLHNLSHEEYNYLFKVLAFGSANPDEYPKLASIGKEIATLSRGSLIMANILADVLRKNLDIQFWLLILKRHKMALENNLLMSGDHPSNTIEKHRRPVYINNLFSSNASIRLLPHHIKRDDCSTILKLRDLIIGATIPPKGKFELVAWESRVPPYTKFVHTCIEEKPQHTTSPSEKRLRWEK